MINPFYEKLAKLAVNYSIKVKKGHRVRIVGQAFATELFQALYAEVIKAGGHPWLEVKIEGTDELLLKHASEEQLIYIDNLYNHMYEEFDSFIWIRANYNTRKLSKFDPKLVSKHLGAPDRKRLKIISGERVAKGELRWVVIPYPCHSFSQEANMDLFTYSKFVEKAIFLDKEDPIEEWRKIKRIQNNIIEYLSNVEYVRILGEDTDLTLSIKGRKWINCCGQENLPDGEIYTGPIEDSVNGVIRFTYPAIYNSREIEDISLEFKRGEVIRVTANKGENLLKELLKIENANRIGEFAIGMNYEIKQFTKVMLFDEKMGGTLHCALGNGFKKSGSKNECSIHLDILKDMRPKGSQIIADGKVIYEEGIWKI